MEGKTKIFHPQNFNVSINNDWDDLTREEVGEIENSINFNCFGVN
jgi:hypothetical protein